MIYDIDSTRVTAGEYWRESKVQSLLLWLPLKWLRVRIPSSTDTPAIDSVAPCEVPESAVPPDIQARFVGVAAEFSGMGFHSPIWHRVELPLHKTTVWWATYLHANGKMAGRIHCWTWRQAQPPRVSLYPVMISAFADGSFLVTSGGKPDLEEPEALGRTCFPNAKPAEVLSRHEAALAKASAKPARALTTADDLRRLSEEAHALSRNFHLARGVFKPLTAEQQKQNDLLAAARQAAAAGQFPEHADVLAEIDNLQNRKRNWTSAVIILAVSILLFLSLGAMRWSTKLVLMLIPILLFHELGHYITMRFFNYRNLRMFFIPWLGAAVVGQNYNVPGWKQVIVSLMGPVPGICLGIGVGIAGIIITNETLIEIALLLLILNGFNLLPILPLDGGWVMHATVFCRHPILSVGFRLVAALALAGLGILSGDRILPYLSIPMFLTLPLTYKTAKIAADLRGRGVEMASPDSQTVPPSTAQAIITEVKKAFPAGQSTKSLAQLALAVFELLNARPPGRWATVLLLALYSGSFVCALVFGLVFILARTGDFGGMMGAVALSADQRPFDPASLQTFSRETTPAAVVNTIVADANNEIAARKAFVSMTNEVPRNCRLTLFGCTLLLSFPPDDEPVRRRWIQRLQRIDPDAFVSSSNSIAGFYLTCVAPGTQKAGEISSAALGYLEGQTHGMGLIPPWSRFDPRTADERARDDRARSTYTRLMETLRVPPSDSETPGLYKRLSRAQREGDTATVKEITDRIQRMTEARKNRAIESLRRQTNVDAAVIDSYLKLEARVGEETSEDREEMMKAWDRRREQMRELGSMMGQAATNQPGVLREQARWGTVTRSGLILQFYHLSFSDPATGPESLVEWLQDQGCRTFKYQFRPGYYAAGLPEE